MGIKRFEDIEGWQMARGIDSNGLPGEQEWRDQIRAAAGSSMHNIAEGFDGGSHAEFAKFLSCAQRSCSEGQSQLYIALDESSISQQEFSTMYEQAAATKCKIGAFIKYLKDKRSV